MCTGGTRRRSQALHNWGAEVDAAVAAIRRNLFSGRLANVLRRRLPAARPAVKGQYSRSWVSTCTAPSTGPKKFLVALGASWM
jgi:hypothetical protein